MTKIDIAKSYQTRMGEKVRLISDQGPEEYPIVGYVRKDTSPSCWTADGYYYNNNDLTDNDLIPVPQTIKTLPYRRFVRKCDEGYYTDVIAQYPSEPKQLQYIEAHRNFVRWVDADWITESFEIDHS